MARSKKIDSESTGKLSDAAKRALDFVTHLNDEKATTLKDAKANMVEFISSGSYSFNRMISGSYFKGYASNRLYALHGPSGCGKSLLAGCAAREAQKMGYQIIYYDTENAIDKEFCQRLGINYEEVIIRTPETISEFRNMTSNDMKKWREMYGEKAKIFMICDSIGNLLGTKESNDINEGKSASDMGQRAKELRTCARALTNKCGHFNIPMIVVNHSYEQSAANPMAAPTRKMSGGEGFIYACTGIISLKKSAIKEAEKDAEGNNKKITKGVILKAKTDKNRVVPEGLECEILLSFTKGLSKYYGLAVDALEHGFFEKKGTRITVKHLDKSFFEKHLYLKQNANDIWIPILQDLNTKVESVVGYENIDSDEDLEEIIESESDGIEVSENDDKTDED
jgi:recombination protein RecA